MVPLSPAQTGEAKRGLPPNPEGAGYLRQSRRRGRVRGCRGSSCGLWSFVHFMGLCIRIPSLSAGTGTAGMSWRQAAPRHLSPVHISPENRVTPTPQHKARHRPCPTDSVTPGHGTPAIPSCPTGARREGEHSQATQPAE